MFLVLEELEERAALQLRVRLGGVLEDAAHLHDHDVGADQHRRRAAEGKAGDVAARRLQDDAHRDDRSGHELVAQADAHDAA